MATAHEKLATSLKELRKLQKRGRVIIRSDELARVHRERLEKAGYLEKIIHGWLLSKMPGVASGDSTPWFACFWEFCRRYCHVRFGKSWYLAPELSLRIHSGDMNIPNQVVVYARKGQSNMLQLPFDVRLIDLPFPEKQKIRLKDITVLNGLNVLDLPLAICAVPPSFFQGNATAAEIVLGSIEDASQVLSPLLERGRTTVAGRLAGAFRHIGRKDIASEIRETMKDAGHRIVETNPFDGDAVSRAWSTPESPLAGRIKTLWSKSRAIVLAECTGLAAGPQDADTYLAAIKDAYNQDAYHSLSIEGYMVSNDLIERVAAGGWNPETDVRDAHEKEALACRGYWECFEKVVNSVQEVLGGAGAGSVARQDHRSWYRALFAPHVQAGLLNAVALAGYRNHPVYIKGSRHVPVNEASVSDAMNALFYCLENEDSPLVAAILGHWLFGYIHPYADGNGRMARFLMNLMLASGGYSWITIKVDNRDEYMAALEAASVDDDIRPFVRFIAQYGGQGA